MCRLFSVALLAFIACPGPIEETPNPALPSDAGSVLPVDGGWETPGDAGDVVADAGGLPLADAGGGVVPPDAGVAMDAGSAAPDAGVEPQPELSDVFIDNPLGTYEILDLWIDEAGEEAPVFEGLVFADNGATAMMADLSGCIPSVVFAEWRVNGEGQLLTYGSSLEVEGDLLLGAVSDNGTMTIQFPGGGAVLRRIRTDCHTMENHVGAWQMMGEEPEQQMTVVLTDAEDYVVMISNDPCFPFTSATYDLVGPWLRIAEEDDDEMGDSVPIFVKRGSLYLGGVGVENGEGTPPLERIDRCEDGAMSLPPQVLAGTYRTRGNNPPAPYIAMGADGQFTLLTAVSPCSPVSSGQYTANNTLFGYRVGEQAGLGRYMMEGTSITVYQGVEPQAPVWLNLTRVRTECH
ncbi:MAG: hypothetical protein VX405_05990 [Myxococcota bacterium]|nr:hypothetical protein [Myxococcota bacterium]